MPCTSAKKSTALTAASQAQYGIEAPCSMLQGIFDPQGSTIYSNRSLTPQQATGNALAPGFRSSVPGPECRLLAGITSTPLRPSLFCREGIFTYACSGKIASLHATLFPVGPFDGRPDRLRYYNCKNLAFFSIWATLREMIIFMDYPHVPSSCKKQCILANTQGSTVNLTMNSTGEPGVLLIHKYISHGRSFPAQSDNYNFSLLVRKCPH
jgi:hypothetical protein